MSNPLAQRIRVAASAPDSCVVCQGGVLELRAIGRNGFIGKPFPIFCPHHEYPYLPYFPLPIRDDLPKEAG